MTARILLRRTGYACGVLAVVVAAVAVVAHVAGRESNTFAITASFVPFLLAAGIVGLAVLALVRAWRTLAVGVVVVLTGLWTQLPLYVRNAPAPATSDGAIRLLQANIRLGQADPDALVELVRSRDVDVLTVEELTESATVRLRESGLEELLPDTFLEAKDDGGGGTGIYSRYPLREGERLDGFAMANLVTRLDLGGGRTVTVAAVHPMPPYPSPAWRWASEMGRLRGALGAAADRGDPVVVGGDFNSTWSHSRYRDLLGDGFTDAGELAGAGFVPTYPADRWYPALLAIDHVVVRDAAVGVYERVDLPGSDHHGIFTTVTPEFAATDGTRREGSG